MAAEARLRVAERSGVEVRVGDAHALPLPDGSIDRARADRVLQHLAQPAQAVAELRRVVRPNGLVTLAEPDWDTLVVDDRDVETSRAYTRFIVEHVVRNAAIGRQLARLLVEAGFQVRRVEATPVIFREFEAAETVLRLRSVCERAWRAGAFTEEAGRAWLGRMERGPFLACFLLLTAVGHTQPASE
jgi:ubiquinone/menaquinone biosynthesis C-methylase UbiE